MCMNGRSSRIFPHKPEGVKEIGLDSALAHSPRLRRVNGVTRIDDALTLFSDITGADCVPAGQPHAVRAGRRTVCS